MCVGGCMRPPSHPSLQAPHLRTRTHARAPTHARTLNAHTCTRTRSRPCRIIQCLGLLLALVGFALGFVCATNGWNTAYTVGGVGGWVGVSRWGA